MSTGEVIAVPLFPMAERKHRNQAVKPKMVTGKWYWAPKADDLHSPFTARGPFDSEVDAKADAFREVASNPQLTLPGINCRRHFFTGRASSPSIDLPEFDLDCYFDDVRTQNMPWESAENGSCGDEWDNWLFDVSPDTVEQLNEAFKSDFQKWIADNGLHPPVCGIDNMSYHVV